MVSNKYITNIIMILMAIATAFCLLAVLFSDKLTDIVGGKGVNVEYESKLFDTSEVIEIDIQMDEEDWNEMLSNAMSEEYYTCDVIINGEKFSNVAIRPKGNTSLSAIAMDPDTDRYSFKLEFGHFVEGQTCYGLDKLILNNNYADATNMKEAIVYDMYQYLDADASLYNYATLSLNGEYKGVYLALEAVEQSFMLRNYGTQDGEIYKPESMGMGGGNSDKNSSSGGFPGGGNMPDMGNFPGGDFNFEGMPDMGNFPGGGFGNNSDSSDSDSNEKSDSKERPDMGSFPGGGFGNNSDSSDSESSEKTDSNERPDMGNFPGGGFSMGGNGANLNYTDDDLDSYSTIWEGEITKTGDKDHKRVVKALKNISEGNDLEEYLDIDNVLKYMAVHTFAVNMDSLSGSMAHNYYLYEYDGKLNIIPWDYNLSFGGMNMGNSQDATEMVNFAIDTPFSSTQFFDALLENEEYLEKYHSYLQQLTEEYVNGGRFDEVYQRIRSQIDSLVETDPTAFYTGEEYSKAAEIFYEVVKLRAESIEGQLNGTIPSTKSGQSADSSALIDASHINVKDMGEFSMGENRDGDFKKNSEKNRPRGWGNSNSDSDSNSSDAGNSNAGGPGAGGPGSDDSNTGGPGSGGPGDDGSNAGGPGVGESEGNSFQVPDNMNGFDFNPMSSQTNYAGGKIKNLIIYSVLLAAAVIGLIIVKLKKVHR